MFPKSGTNTLVQGRQAWIEGWGEETVGLNHLLEHTGRGVFPMSSYWLFKSEPTVFSLDDLSRSSRQTTCWEGVRNYQARNFLRVMAVGDQAFFYHSNTTPPSIVGIVKIVKAAYPDYFAWDSHSPYFDEKSSPDNPIWLMVDVKFVSVFPTPCSLDTLRSIKGLEIMELLRKGSRLSVQPVREEEWNIILQLAHAGPKRKRVQESKG